MSWILLSIGVFVFYVCSAAAVMLALKRLELSVAYAIWSGVGTALTALIGIAHFREPLTLIKLGLIARVVVGVAGLSLAGKSPLSLQARAGPASLVPWTVFLTRTTG